MARIELLAKVDDAPPLRPAPAADDSHQAAFGPPDAVNKVRLRLSGPPVGSWQRAARRKLVSNIDHFVRKRMPYSPRRADPHIYPGNTFDADSTRASSAGCEPPSPALRLKTTGTIWRVRNGREHPDRRVFSAAAHFYTQATAGSGWACRRSASD